MACPVEKTSCSSCAEKALNHARSAISQVSKAVASQSAIPILKGIKMVASDKGIELTGSDSNVSVVSFIPTDDKDGETLAEIERDGSIAPDGKFFSDIVKKLPKDDLQIDVSEFVSTVKSGESKFTLNRLDAEEYP